jgi:hypothetical protein
MNFENDCEAHYSTPTNNAQVAIPKLFSKDGLKIVDREFKMRRRIGDCRRRIRYVSYGEVLNSCEARDRDASSNGKISVRNMMQWTK